MTRAHPRRCASARPGRPVPMLAVGAALLVPLGNGSAQAPDNLVVSWWGYNAEKFEASVVRPFEASCGCELILETGSDADRLYQLLARDGRSADVILLDDRFSQIGIEANSFLPIDRDRLLNLDQLHEIARAPQGEYGPAYTIGRAGLVHDAARVEPLTAWKDLWREDLAGAIALPGIDSATGPEVVIKAGEHAGVNAYDDPDAAFAALERLKPNIVGLYSSGAELIELMSDGRVSVAMAPDSLLGDLERALPTVAWADLADGDIATLNTLNIPKAAREVDLAYRFIDFMLSTEVQRARAEQRVAAPANAQVTLTPEQAEGWAYGPTQIGALQRMDYDRAGAVRIGWVARWNALFDG